MPAADLGISSPNRTPPLSLLCHAVRAASHYSILRKVVVPDHSHLRHDVGTRHLGLSLCIPDPDDAGVGDVGAGEEETLQLGGDHLEAVCRYQLLIFERPGGHGGAEGAHYT